MADDKGTGTQPGEGAGDGAPTPAVAPETAGGGAPVTREEFSALQTMLMEQFAQLRANAPTQPQPTPTHEPPGEEDWVTELKLQAAAGDVKARGILRTLDQQQQVVEATVQGLKQVSDQVFTLKLPEAERGEFEKWYRQNGRFFQSPAAAHDAFRAPKLEAEAAALRAEVAKLKAGSPAAGVVATTAREVTAKEAQARQSMTGQAFAAEIARLRDAGDFEGARELQKKVLEDKVDIT